MFVREKCTPSIYIGEYKTGGALIFLSKNKNSVCLHVLVLYYYMRILTTYRISLKNRGANDLV